MNSSESASLNIAVNGFWSSHYKKTFIVMTLHAPPVLVVITGSVRTRRREYTFVISNTHYSLY